MGVLSLDSDMATAHASAVDDHGGGSVAGMPFDPPTLRAAPLRAAAGEADCNCPVSARQYAQGPVGGASYNDVAPQQLLDGVDEAAGGGDVMTENELIAIMGSAGIFSEDALAHSRGMLCHTRARSGSTLEDLADTGDNIEASASSSTGQWGRGSTT